jgi:spore germination cell wall hydrolase CwlJ-like protein
MLNKNPVKSTSRDRPKVEQRQISPHKRDKIRLIPNRARSWRDGRGRAMYHHPFENDVSEQRRKAATPKKRRTFGLREFAILAIAFALLMLLPTSAQFGKSGPVELTDGLGAMERPEENFAGSAFYFLDPADTVASQAQAGEPMSDDMLASLQLDGKLPTAAFENGRAGAQPFTLTPGTANWSRALKCLTDAIYYEAANEPDDGQRAVAQVIINRMRHPTYPNSICGVIYQGSERTTGCQFSYSCDGSMRRVPARPAWLRAQRVAMAALSGYVFTPVGMATHYHATYVYPYWAPSLNFLGTIGAHRFYSWKGSAGRPSAFFSRHNGAEPFPGPRPRAWTPNPAPVLDPIQLQKQYEREYAALREKAERDAVTAARNGYSPPPAQDFGAAPAPRTIPQYAPPSYSKEAQVKGGEARYGGGNLPGSSNVKPEFQQSGSWKTQPSGG